VAIVSSMLAFKIVQLELQSLLKFS